MYQEFFSLTIKPFSISPDPNFLFLSERHKEAIAHLEQGLQSNTGFALLTGEVGTGKTTICRSLLEKMGDNSDISFILNPALNDIELLSTLCDNFNIDHQTDNLSQLFEILTRWLIHNCEANRRSIVIIDEAQHLSFAALDQLRLLTEIETNGKKPLQVMLIGQTELQTKLKQIEFRPLAQRITARYHLLSLTQQESNLYIQHRLNIAGSNHAIFDKSALQEIYKICTGTPRLTNILCDRSLLAAYTQDSHIVTFKMVKEATQEIHFSAQKHHPKGALIHWRLMTLLLLTLLTAWQMPQIWPYFNHTPLLSAINLPTTMEKSAPLREVNAQWFDEYPQLDLTKTTYNDALSSLYSVWGYQVMPDDVSCHQKNNKHIHCYTQEMDLQQLILLNYPSVVKLQRKSGHSLYAVIYKVAEDYQLLIDGNIISVTEQWFNRYWRGETTLLWQSPFASTAVIKRGQQGENVAWLANQLNRIQDKPNEHKIRFDTRLLEQVIGFQREQGLIADGIVGPQTLMYLTAPYSPRLAQEKN